MSKHRASGCKADPRASPDLPGSASGNLEMISLFVSICLDLSGYYLFVLYIVLYYIYFTLGNISYNMKIDHTS
jgi:hypothetical protein